MTEHRVTRLSNYLTLDDEDTLLQAITQDSGDGRLNDVVSFLSHHFNSRDENLILWKDG